MPNEIKPRIVDGEAFCSKHSNLWMQVNEDNTESCVACQRDQALAKLDQIQKLDRYNAYSAAGYEGSGDSWVDIDKEPDGEWVKYGDMMAIIQDKGEG